MARTRRRPELHKEGQVRCRYCGGFYDPALPECPNCGYQTEENQNYATDWKTIGPEECAGGFGGPKSPVQTAAKWLGGLLIGLVVVVAVVNIGKSLSTANHSARTVAAVSSSSVVPAQEGTESAAGSSSVAAEQETAKKTDAEAKDSLRSIQLSKTDLTLKAEETQALSAAVDPEDWKGTLKWSTSNQYVAWVDQKGKITCMGGGKCEITVAAGKVKAQCQVQCDGAKADHDTVDAWVAKQTQSGEKKDDQKEAALTLNMKDMTLVRKEDSYHLLADGGDGHYTWTSSNTAVATVNDGGVVTAVGNGTTIITCTTESGQTAECRIHVTYG